MRKYALFRLFTASIYVPERKGERRERESRRGEGWGFFVLRKEEPQTKVLPVYVGSICKKLENYKDYKVMMQETDVRSRIKMRENRGL